MENAVDALKIAFAIFVFVVAITITFSVISQAKQTSDYVLYFSDETNFYKQLDSSDENRMVSVSEVISNLCKYYKESISVIIKLDNENSYNFDNGRETICDPTLSNVSLIKDKEQNLEYFIKNELLTLDQNTKFEEEFVEVPISGIYKTGSDGTQIVSASGGNKVYITYIKK